MSYRHPRYHAPADNTIEGTIEGIGQFCILVFSLVGIFAAPIAIWHLNDAISQPPGDSTHELLKPYR